jgi:hypothetical protein
VCHWLWQCLSKSPLVRSSALAKPLAHLELVKQPFFNGQLSPLLANILLDDLDKELERRGLPFVRYADDMVIFTKSLRSAQRVFASVSRYLTDDLHLVVNQEKSRKGYWHMAKTIASGVGMTNAWLQEQGLVSLKSLWASLAPLR